MQENINKDPVQSQTDLDSIFRNIETDYPAMRSIIEYAKNVAPANKAEYKELLENIRKHNEDEEASAKRILDLLLCAIIKTAYTESLKHSESFEDIFQNCWIEYESALDLGSRNSNKTPFRTYINALIKNRLAQDCGSAYQMIKVPGAYINTIRLASGEGLSASLTSLETVYDLLMTDPQIDDLLAYKIASAIAVSEDIDTVPDDEDENTFHYFGEPTLEQKTINSTIIDDLYKCVEGLPENQKNVLVHTFGLYSESPKSADAIGKIFHISPSTVGQLQFKALKALIPKMKNEGYALSDFIF